MGLAGVGWIVEGFGGPVAFGGFEEESVLAVVGETREASFAVGVGADLEVEFADAGEAVSDVNLNGGGVDRLARGVSDGEVGGAGAEGAVDDRDRIRVGTLRDNGDETG